MRLRVALKIYNAIGGDRNGRYTGAQQSAALRRHARLKSSKATEAFWRNYMDELGTEGRAEYFRGIGKPGVAFAILMDDPDGAVEQLHLSFLREKAKKP